MNFAVRFFKSLYSFDEYNKMMKYSVFGAAFNVLVVSVISALIIASPFIADYLRLGGIEGAVNKYVPEFTIKDGVLSADKYYKNEIEEFTLFVVDTKGVYTQEDLFKYESGFIVAKDKMITKFPTGDIMEQSYDEFEAEGITGKEDVKKLIPGLKGALVLLGFIFGALIFIGNMFYAAVSAVVMNIIDVRRKVRITMRDTFKVSCYAISTPVLFKSVLSCIDTFVGGGYSIAVPAVIHFGVIGVFCFFAFKAVKADILREEKEKKGASLKAAAENDRRSSG